MNRRGEVVTLVLVAVAVTALAVAALPALNPFRSLSGGGDSASGKEASSFSKQVERPIILSSPQVPNQAVVAYERTYETGAKTFTPKLTLGQRIGAFFERLTTWGVVLVIVLLATGCITPAALIAWSRHTIRSAFKNTVSAIRETDDETFGKLKSKLAEKHDKRDKRIVDKLKGELH